MKIATVVSFLEEYAPSVLQEAYDNSGLLIGHPEWDCTGIVCALDVTAEVIEEAVLKKCNMVVVHHPLIFKGIKKINGDNHVERTVIAAIKNNIAVYAIHTNLDNVIRGVSGKMADLLGLKNTRVLQRNKDVLKKLFCFVPPSHLEAVRNAVFTAGAGTIGNYSECSFSHPGTGTFTAGEGTNPFIGKVGERHVAGEEKLEVIYFAHNERSIISALKASHPYEEVAIDIISLDNTHQGIGSGIIGTLQNPLDPAAFLEKLKQVFRIPVIRHTIISNKPIHVVALCGGAGSFLIAKALGAGADAFVTADLKYHEFFEGNGKMLLADIGHFESEQFTINLLAEILEEKFPTFAVLKTGVNTNPVRYYQA